MPVPSVQFSSLVGFILLLSPSVESHFPRPGNCNLRIYTSRCKTTILFFLNRPFLCPTCHFWFHGWSRSSISRRK